MGLKSDLITALERLNENTNKKSKVYICKHPDCSERATVKEGEFKGVKNVKEHIDKVHR